MAWIKRSLKSVTAFNFLFYLLLSFLTGNIFAQSAADTTSYRQVIIDKASNYSDSTDALLKELLLPYIDSAQLKQQYAASVVGLSYLIYDKHYQSTLEEKKKWDGRIQNILLNHEKTFFSQDSDSSIFKDYQQKKANLLYEEGAYTKAISAFKKLIEQRPKETFRDSLYINTWYSYLGSAYLILDNPDRAIYNYQQYIAFIPDRVEAYYGSDYMRFYNILGWSYLGGCWTNKSFDEKEPATYKKALDSYHRALSLINQLDNPNNFTNTILSTYSGLVSLQQQYAYYDSASIYLDQSFAFMDAESTQLESILYLKGKEANKNKQYNQAIDYFNEAEQADIKISGPNHHSLYDKYLGKARAYAGMGDYEKALDACSRSLSFLTKPFKGKLKVSDVIYVPEAIDVLTTRADLIFEYARKKPKDSLITQTLEAYQQAVDLSLSDRGRHLRNEARQQRINRHRQLISNALEACYFAQEHIDEHAVLEKAFKFIEQGKGLLLFENFREEEVLRKINLNEDLRQQLDSVKSQLRMLSTRIASDEDKGVFERLKLSEDKYDSLLQSIEQQYPEYYQKASVDVSLSDVLNDLPNDQSFLSFYAGDSTLFLVAGNNLTSRFIKIEGYNEIGHKVESVLKNSKSPSSGQNYGKDLHALYVRLIAPVSDLIEGTKRLLVLPDGYLGYLSFDLLLEGEVSSNDFSSWPFLIRNKSVGYEYSMNLYLYKSVSETREGGYVGFAPTYPQDSLKEMMVYNQDSIDFIAERSFGSLSYNKDEVRAANQLFGGKVFIDSEATEEKFRENTKEANLLHLSMHAFYDEKNPDHSGLVFSNYKPRSFVSSNDGFLPIGDLYNMHLGAELAIISACETGYGYLERGEGVASIGRAFKYAGCPTVTMSLWYANDRATSQIMTDFTSHLDEGMTKDEALRLAKLNYLNKADANTAHPYYWSAFVVNGNMEPLKDRQSSSTRYLFLIGLAIVGLIIFLLRKRRQST